MSGMVIAHALGAPFPFQSPPREEKGHIETGTTTQPRGEKEGMEGGEKEEWYSVDGEEEDELRRLHQAATTDFELLKGLMGF